MAAPGLGWSGSTASAGHPELSPLLTTSPFFSRHLTDARTVAITRRRFCRCKCPLLFVVLLVSSTRLRLHASPDGPIALSPSPHPAWPWPQRHTSLFSTPEPPLITARIWLSNAGVVRFSGCSFDPVSSTPFCKSLSLPREGARRRCRYLSSISPVEFAMAGV